MLLLRMLGLIIIMFLLCDADSTCPPDSTPLQVEPTVIIREYGDHVDVNCSHYDNHLDILWRVGNNTLVGDNDYDYFTLSLSLSDWNMSAECIVKINESHECSKHLEINVYKNPEVVLSTKNVQALGDETLYELQCDILDVAPVENLVLRWYTNNELNKTDVFNNTIRTPVNESGTLTLRVRREDNVVQVTCEAQLVFGPSGSLPSVSHTHSVSAHYAPELKIQSNTQDIYVAEGDDISLNCEAEGNPPPVFQWTSDGLSVLEEDSDTLNITQVNASSTYICTATNNLGSITKQIHVHVTNVNVQATPAAAPLSPLAPETGCPVTLTPPEIVVRFGDPVSVNCTTSDADSTCPPGSTPLQVEPAVIIREYGDHVDVNCSHYDNHLDILWRVGNNTLVGDDDYDYFTLSLSLSDWNMNAECIVKINESHECSKHLEINVYKNPEVVLSTKNVQALGDETLYELQCDILDVAPIENLVLRWYTNNELNKTDVFNNTIRTPVNESSTLTLRVRREDNVVQVTCEAQLVFGPSGSLPSVFHTHNVSAHYAPELKIQSNTQHIDVAEGDDISLNCEAEGNPPPVFQWTSDGLSVLEEDSDTLNITQVNASSTYICTAANNLGNITKQIHVHVTNVNVQATPAAAPLSPLAPETGCPVTLTPPEIVVRFGDPVSVNCTTSDADSTCPPDSTPLQVEPAVIIKEYGDHVDVNCSHYDNHLHILWRVGNNTFVGDNDYFVMHNLSLSDWNMNAECIVKINDSHECSKHLEINVYKNPEVILSTKNVQALGDETLYELQCDILDVAPVENLVLRWYTNNELNKTDDFSNTIRTPVNESSTLTLRVRREDNVVQVTCEAQLVFGPSGSLPSVFHTHNVSAHYAPELKIQSNTQHIDVAEGEDISLNCEAEGNPPPVFQWTSDGLSVLEEDSDTLNITQVNASSTYICTATNNLGSITKQIHVHVTNVNVQATPAAAPLSPLAPETGCPVTLTPPEIVVRFGDPVSVNCNTSGDKGLGWEATVGGTGLENVAFLPWTVENLNTWNPLASCYTFVNDKQCEKHLNFTVYQTPDQVSVLDDGPMLEGKEYQLLCSITNVAPVRKLKVKWYRGHETLFEETFNDTVLTSQNLNSTLRITPTKENNGAVFTCQAELHLGPNGPKFLQNKTSAPYTAVVHYTPIIINCPAQYVVEHNYSLDMLPCKADGNPSPTVNWYHEDEVVNPSVPLSRNDSGNYRAEFENSVGTDSTTVQITVEYEPSFTCSETYDVKVNGELQCEPEGLPTPTLTWFKDGQNIAPPRWTKEDSGEYLLQASNKHGSANHTLRVNILYTPIILNCPAQYVVEHKYSLDMLPCKADGNPSPTVNWYHEDEVVNPSVPLSRNDSGNYRAEFENSVGTDSTTVQITVEYEPSFTCSETYDVKVNGELQCEPEGLPTPTLTWFKDGQNIAPPRWTKEDSGEYLLQASNKHGSANHTLRVNILYAPELKIQSNTQDIDVAEGDDISLNCEAEGNPPPVFQWTSDGLSVLEEDSDTLNITQVNASSTYICTAGNYLGNITKQIHVHVTNVNVQATPLAPEIGCPVTLTPPEIVVRFGDPVSVNCTTSGDEGLGWEATVGDTGLENVAFLPWTVENLNTWNPLASCYTFVNDKQCEKHLNFTVYQTPDQVSVLDDGPMLEGKEYQLLCSITNVAPVRKLKVKWYRGHETLFEDTLGDTVLTSQNLNSTLRITPTKENNGAVFTCQAELHLGPNGPKFLPNKTSAPYTAVVHYTPIIINCPAQYVVEHKYSLDMLPCKADGNPSPTVNWYHEDEVVNPSVPLSRNDSGNYRAEFENSVGTDSTTVQITVEYEPSFTCSETYDVKVNGELQCEPEGLPTPTLTWFKDGQNIAPPQWTKEDSGEYLLQASNKHGSANHTLRVNILYAPELKIQSNTQDIDVAEGDDISLNCEAEGNPPPVFQWTSDGLSVLEEDSDTLNITQVNASSTYICTAANNLGNITKQIHVHVTNVNVQATPAAAPLSPLAPETGCPVTLTPPEIVVRFGDPVSVNCTTSGDKGLGWKATVGDTGLENVTVLPWTVQNLNTWNPLASCYTFANDKQCEKSLNFTVYQTPDQVSVLDDGPMLEGKEYQLLCSITNVAPVQKLKVKWYRGHETLFEDTFNDTSLVVLTSQNLNSTLSITPTKENNGAVFTCQAELHLGPNGPKFLPNKTSAPYIAVVHYTPIIINCPAQYAVKHKYSLDTLLCKADGNPPPTVKWYHEDQVMNPSVPLSRNDSGNYRAEFKNSVGPNSTTVQITVEYEPSFTCSETYDVKVNGELQCEPEGLPTPTLTWFKDGQNIAPPQWTKEDSGEYLLQASNKHGSANHTLRVNILYAPELKIQSNTQDIDVAEGDDISLNCEAEGNPPPVFQWTSDGLSVLEEDSDTLSITQVNASSTYICTATNNLGKITKQIHVHVTNVNAQATPLAPETGHFPPWLWLAIIISVIILTISIFVVFLRLCQKKEGQYRFVQQSDISMSIMTNEGNENLI
ncbi:hemicentin-1-like isoform X2 [Mugil cephalus]|uniref:hemicentin-1-like isoform X2 n=1 Tax=Mugil cephalus TaxID=48193 RepID=UPI001FB836E6|nr:hemicentin-1-like isoform X2 [Mugil cephalus]